MSNIPVPRSGRLRRWSGGHASAEGSEKSTGRIPYLHGLRGFAAFGVVITHTAFYTGRSLHGDPLARLLSRLDYGVALFFVLSGFLLYRSMLRPALGIGSRVSWLDYAVSRWLRIVPVYVVTLLCVWALYGLKPLNVNDVWLMLTFTKVYSTSPEHPQLTHMWSLDVEVAFYVLLPCLAWYGARPGPPEVIVRRNVWLMSFCTIVWALWLAALWQTGWVHHHDATLMWLPTKLPWFLGGMCLAILQVMWRDSARSLIGQHVSKVVHTVQATPLSWLAVSTGCAVLAATDLAGPYDLRLPGPFESTAKVVLYGVSATLLVGLALCDAFPRPVAMVLEWRPVVWLGEISFSLFLIHQVFIVLAADMWGLTVFGGGLLPVLTVVTVMSLLSAYCLFVFVERPTMALAKTLRSKNRNRGNSNR